MCSTSYVVVLLASLIALAAVGAAPQTSAADAAATAAAASAAGADEVVYDQRQNGTENVRISLSDLKVVVAPADGLFQIMSMAGAQLLNTDLSAAASENKPSAVDCNGFKCNNRIRQAAKKNRFKLSSLIVPLLNNQAEQKTGNTDNNNTH